jgi:hypothetical protein
MARQGSFMAIILPDYYDPERGYRLCTMWPGAQGFFPSNYFCGHDLDLAIEFANNLNQERGYCPQLVADVFEIASGLSTFHFFET